MPEIIESFEDAMKKVQEHAKDIALFFAKKQDCMLAVTADGNFLFNELIFNFMNAIAHNYNAVILYEKTKIWCHAKKGNSVEIFFNYDNEKNIRTRDENLRFSMYHHKEDWNLVKQVLKIPDGFIGLYFACISSPDDNENKWFSLNIHVRDKILISIT